MITGWKGSALETLVFSIFYTGMFALLSEKTLAQVLLNGLLTSVLFFCWTFWVNPHVIKLLSKIFKKNILE